MLHIHKKTHTLDYKFNLILQPLVTKKPKILAHYSKGYSIFFIWIGYIVNRKQPVRFFTYSMYKRFLKITLKMYFGYGSRSTCCGSLPYSVKWQQFIKSSIDQSWHKKVQFQKGKGFVFLLAIDLFSLLPSSCWIQPSQWGEIVFEEALLFLCSTVFTILSLNSCCLNGIVTFIACLHLGVGMWSKHVKKSVICESSLTENRRPHNKKV